MKIFYKMAASRLRIMLVIAGILTAIIAEPLSAQAHTGGIVSHHMLLISVSNTSAVSAQEHRTRKQLERRFNRLQKFLKKHARGYYNAEGGWNFEWSVASIIIAAVGVVSLVLMFATPWFFSLFLVLLAILLLVLKGFGVLHF